MESPHLCSLQAFSVAQVGVVGEVLTSTDSYLPPNKCSCWLGLGVGGVEVRVRLVLGSYWIRHALQPR